MQQRVEGLSVNASRTVVPLNGSVSFSTPLEAGSDVRYCWVLCDRCAHPGEPTISYTFRSVGTFNIIVTAESPRWVLPKTASSSTSCSIEELGGGGGFLLPHQHPAAAGCGAGWHQHLLQLGRSAHWAAPQQPAAAKAFSLTVLEAGTYHVSSGHQHAGQRLNNCEVDFVEPVGWLAVTASPEPSCCQHKRHPLGRASWGQQCRGQLVPGGGLRWETQEPSTTLSFPSPGLCLVTVVAENQLGSANASVEVVVQVPVSGLSIHARNWMAALW